MPRKGPDGCRGDQQGWRNFRAQHPRAGRQGTEDDGSQPHHLEVSIPWPGGGLEKRVDGELLGDGGDGAVAGAEDRLGGEAQDF